MKKLDRRSFLKIGGASLAGLAISRFDIPYLSYLSPKNALAMGSSNAWAFGVLSDTQWKLTAGGEATCATGIIDALNNQFVGHQCKFVIQVGDLADKEYVTIDGIKYRTPLPTRAAHAQVLYDNGIGFFPVRGNHEASATAAGEVKTLFPQTQGNGANVFGAENFNSPVLGVSGNALTGLSYSFDYNNVRCVLIDQFNRADGSNYMPAPGKPTDYTNNAVDQVAWVDSRLSSHTGSDKHTFVFSHKNLIGQNHKDVLFGANLTANAAARDAFITSCSNNGVRYCLGGHDHMHHRSLVSTSDKTASVGQIICSSNSYKFYIPGLGDDGRETPVAQELFTVGYYIFTVDGPRVTVDFYSSTHGQDYGDIDLIDAPPFAFYLRERFGYSLNGDQYIVKHGESYVGIEDSYNGTTAKILSGTNGNTETDYLNRQLTKTINTGWADAGTVAGALSNIFSIWGMVDNLSLYNGDLTGLLPAADESTETDDFALAMTYDPKKVRPSDLVSGRFVIVSKDDQENWVGAVDLNTGGAKTFVYGPWKAQHGLGTYGVDPRTKTVWAVLNHEGDFALKLMNV
jgi:hypothetical protein